MSKNTIDINCDMGESYGNFHIGNDDAVFPYISSSNVACGFHGGDPLVIEKTIRKAMQHNVQVGAHPSYPDLSGFGRRKMHMAHDELKAYVKYQIAAVKGIAESLGTKIRYVKPHGALYNSAADDEEESSAIAEAIAELGEDIAFMGMAGSKMHEAATWAGLKFIAEAFADRRYTDGGRLRARRFPNAVINDPKEAAAQVLSIAKDQKVTSYNGKQIKLHAQSICIHGDNQNVVNILKAIKYRLTRNYIAIKAFETL